MPIQKGKKHKRPRGGRVSRSIYDERDDGGQATPVTRPERPSIWRMGRQQPPWMNALMGVVMLVVGIVFFFFFGGGMGQNERLILLLLYVLLSTFYLGRAVRQFRSR